MKDQAKFIRELNSYKKHLEVRLDNGAKYIDKHNCIDDKYYNTYLNIIKELAAIQSLINHYNMQTL